MQERRNLEERMMKRYQKNIKDAQGSTEHEDSRRTDMMMSEVTPGR